ncbi:MAG: DDE-type integrase/transposase/recombinase [Eubacterium sp.]|nr:DDE-type integrase/transposase/recombinase [Eubacterium sp.]
MKKDQANDWRDATALQRFQMIAPLLDEDLDPSKKVSMRRSIAEQNELSDRTLKRYLLRYEIGGFDGLRPSERTGNLSMLPDNYQELLNEAIQLKREVPVRSVNQIIFILESEGRVAPGVLKRSTLQDHLYKAGFSRKQMKKYAEGRKSTTKRFCKPHRMMLVQADIKYGPYLPIGKEGRKIRTYLCSIIDDHSRFLLESMFYDNQEAEIVETTLRNAVLKFGRFDAVYVDNGRQFVSTQLIQSLSRLGIRVMRARPYSGQSKGYVKNYVM